MGEYFGEVALIKDWPRTATVKSKNYSTWASLDKTKFDKLLERYSFLRKAMEQRISEKYQDKLRKFIKKSLRNIEYLSDSIPEEIIEEISFKLEIKNIARGDYLFRYGTPWKEVYIICMGRIEILISNKKQSIETYLETLYTGWVIGAYNSINYDDYSISGKALTDWVLFKLDYYKIDQLRSSYEELNENIWDWEKFIKENGLPYWDFKFNQIKEFELSPIEKFQNSINRLMRILKSYKSLSLLDLLK